MNEVKQEVSKKYNEIIHKQVESKFDLVFPYAALTCFITAIIVMQFEIPKIFAFVNFIMGSILMFLFVLRRRLNVRVKISVTIFLAISIGFASFLDGGFTSSFATLFALGNIVAVLFMSKKYCYRLGILSIVLYFILWLYNEIYLVNTIFYTTPDRFFIQIIVYILYLIMLNVSVSSIKKSLNDSISKLEVTLAHVNKVAYYDTLTELPNLKHFLMKLKALNPKHGAIIIIHLKSLRVINSIYGEDTGDRLLQFFAIELKKFAKEKSLVARHSGNEFIIYCSEVNELKIRSSIDELIYEVSNSVKRFLFDLNLNYFIGFSYVDENEDIDLCYSHAKIALTYVKKYNTGTIYAFDQELLDNIVKEEVVKNTIDQAIINNEIELYYQEKVDSTINKVIGVEALSRWTHEELGKISPDYFIPIVEKMGFSIRYGVYIIEKAFKDYKKLVEIYGKDVTVSLNISPSHLISHKFIDEITSLKNIYNIPNNVIMIEITEGVMIEDFDTVKTRIDMLHDYGFKVSLDDFGTGYSSINYLATLDIDELKLDKEFVCNISTNLKTYIITESLVEIAKKYRISMIAEGVETESQVQTLQKIGCIYMQGYYYSKPKKLQ